MVSLQYSHVIHEFVQSFQLIETFCFRSVLLQWKKTCQLHRGQSQKDHHQLIYGSLYCVLCTLALVVIVHDLCLCDPLHISLQILI